MREMNYLNNFVGIGFFSPVKSFKAQFRLIYALFTINSKKLHHLPWGLLQATASVHMLRHVSSPDEPIRQLAVSTNVKYNMLEVPNQKRFLDVRMKRKKMS